MARKVISPELKLLRIKRASVEVNGKKRARHLYNLFYRKSKFFKISLVIRLVTIVFSVYIVYFNSSNISFETEILDNAKVEDIHFIYETGTADHKSILLTTDSKNQYRIDLLGSKPETFHIKDTINVARNLFGKKTFVSKFRSQKLNILIKFSRCNNYLIFIIGLSLFSFLLYDGYDRLSRVILVSVLVFDIIGLMVYFVL